jgi:hypothetical protein
MSVKVKIAAGAATFGLVGGGLAMAGTMTASAATPSCGYNCSQIFTQKFGPDYLLDVFQQHAAANQPIIAFQSSNSDPAEDFLVVDEGTVHHFYHNYGLVSSGFAHTYGDDEAYEVQYEPYGLNSNLCVSTWPGETPQPGFLVRLESCGQYSNSIWAADADGFTSAIPMDSLPGSLVRDYRSTGEEFSPRHTDVALINGANDTFSNPLVLNYPAGNPTDSPRPQVNVQPENTYANGTTFDNQEWGTIDGPAHSGGGFGG